MSVQGRPRLQGSLIGVGWCTTVQDLRRVVTLTTVTLMGLATIGAVPAAAESLRLRFDVRDYYGPKTNGSVHAERFGGCSPCPVSLAQQRGGVTIASSDVGGLTVVPQQGDVFRIIVNGIEMAAVTYDNQPTIDNGCVPGGSAFTGSYSEPRGGTVEAFNDGKVYNGTSFHPGSVTANGGRYTATFPTAVPLSQITVRHTYPHSAAGDATLEVVSIRGTSLRCGDDPTGGPKHCTIARLKAFHSFDRVLGRVRRSLISQGIGGLLRTGRATYSILGCGGGRVTSRIWALRGGRKLLLLAKGASGQLPHPGSVVGLQARPKLTPSGRGYLSRTRRAAIRFSLRFSDSAGATYTYTRDVTLTR